MKMNHQDQSAAPALVLGLSPTGLAVVQALGAAGVEVHGADLKQWEIGRYSKYCRFEPELSLRLVPDRVLPAMERFRERCSSTRLSMWYRCGRSRFPLSRRGNAAGAESPGGRLRRATGRRREDPWDDWRESSLW